MPGARSWSWAAAASLVLLVSWADVLLVPYSKIEERFVLHGVHDVLVAPARADWDFRQFPDPVPHSFAGVRALALASLPASLLAPSSAHVELGVRLTLASINAAALLYLVRGLRAAPWALLLTALQFHFLFWAGRTTHNSLVLGPVMVAFRLIFLDPRPARARWGIVLLTFCAALLRSELVGLLAPATAWALLTHRISLPGALFAGLGAGLAALAYGTLCDREAWAGLHGPTLPLGLFLPEWEAVVFNILHGQSKAWGTMPVHWYASRALPRLLTFSLPLVPLGGALVLRDCLRALPGRACGWGRAQACLGAPLVGLALTASFHVALLSLVAHKEWRFIVYTVPVWNMLAARALGALWSTSPAAMVEKDKRRPLARRRALVLLRRSALVAVLAGVGGVSVVSLGASRRNYPGGEAMAALHRTVGTAGAGEEAGGVRVHIDVAATTTGATLFQALHLRRGSASGCGGAFGSCWLPPVLRARAGEAAWEYSRAEDLAGARWTHFTHLVTPAPDCRSPARALAAPGGGEAQATHPVFQPLDPPGPIRAFAGMQRVGGGTYVRQARAVLGRGLGLGLGLGLGGGGGGAGVGELLPLRFRMDDALHLCVRQRVDEDEPRAAAAAA